MDIQKLSNLKHWLEYSAFTLSLENYVVLTNSLLLIQSENHFRKIFFWGIIQGLEADYFISFGYEKDAIKEKKYFYSDDCQNWKLLPTPQREHLALAQLCKRPFQGDPGLVVEVVDEAPPEDFFPDENTSMPEDTEVGSQILKMGQASGAGEEEKVEEENADEEEGPKKSQLASEGSEIPTITSGELKEEDRLAAVVQIITEEAAVAPRGGIFKQTDGLSVHSRAFEGIKLDEADSLCSFQHYRIPQYDYNTNLLTRCDYNYAIDFLDTIDKDIPEDCWSAQLVEGDRTIILRNLYWPGYMFFHCLNTPDYGFFYMGNGHRNLDIPFMTQVALPVIPAKQEDETEEISEDQSVDQRMTVTSEQIRPSRLSTKLETKLGTRLDTKLGTKLQSKLETKLSVPIENDDI